MRDLARPAVRNRGNAWAHVALTLGTVFALVAALLVPGAPAAEAATGSGACAKHRVPATGFTDTTTTRHRTAIDCSVWWGLVEGQTATRFAPTAEVTRGQTAAMIARLLRTTGDAPATSPSAGFTDTVGHRFEADIDLLTSLGIVTGITTGRFAPDRPVSRAQMASLLVRTFAYGYDRPLAPGPVPFRDVSADDVHRGAIGRLVAADITSGVTATTFEPGRPVPRDQMASFVTRSVEILVRDGLAERPTTRPAADDAYHSRMRGAWVHLFDDTLKSRAGIRAMVDELAAADVNVIIAQVIRRQDAYYTSTVLPRTADRRIAPDVDVLAELIVAARARGIEVHAWFSVAPTWHDTYRDLPAPQGWMHTEHGLAAPESRRWVSRTVDGAWSSYLDPGVPGVRAHVAAVVRELATNYELDGIHLDYVRYESERHGYNPIALARYRAETGATGTPAPTDARWMQWRRDQTHRVIVGAREAIRASGNRVELSAAVITWGDGPATRDRAGFQRTLPYTRALQDWDGWVRRGDVDAVMPMNYFRAHDPTQARWFARWIDYEADLAHRSAAQIVPGPAGYLNRPPNVVNQVRAAMVADGAMVYSYQQPTEDSTREVWTRLAQTRWGYAPRR
jgi:uncharacterized lipoprotein YddW (UPF0748 family)